MAEESIRSRPAAERERLSEQIADRLDKPMTALGVLFLLLVLAETATDPQGVLATTYTVASWGIWPAFVAEFALRAFVAPSPARFWRRNWWQLIFLALPFLRFVPDTTPTPRRSMKPPWRPWRASPSITVRASHG
jgi:voltage-gated potassium channel